MRKDEAMEAFNRFWSIWKPIKRRNDGPGDARKAFQKQINSGTDPQDIIDGATAYIRKLPSGYEYVPLAATWINRETFADYASEERDYQSRLQQSRERSENVVQIKPVLPANHFLNRYREG